MTLISGADVESRLRAGVARVRGAGIVVSLLSALLATWLAFSRPDASWVLASLTGVAALLVAFGLRCGRGESSSEVRVLDPFLAVSFLTAVVVPLTNVVNGPPNVSFRPVAGLDAAIVAEGALVAFLGAVILGWKLSAGGSKAAQPEVHWPPSWVGASVLCLGLLGLLIRVGGGIRPGAESLTSPGVAGGPLGFAGTALTPLLAVGTFLLVARPNVGMLGRLSAGLLLVPLTAVGLSTFTLNRAMFVVPVLAMFVVLVRVGHVKRVGRTLLLLTATAVVFFLAIGSYRAEVLGGAGASEVGAARFADANLQVYLQSPYLVGSAFATDEAAFGAGSLVASVLAPIPAVGEGFREATGGRIYNHSLYGGVANDQILPVWAEIERSTGVIGLLAAAVLLGIVMAWLSRRIGRLDDPMRLYAAAFSALWLAQVPIVSLSVLAQIGCYFILPVTLLASFARKGPRDVAPPANRETGIWPSGRTTFVFRAVVEQDDGAGRRRSRTRLRSERQIGAPNG